MLNLLYIFKFFECGHFCIKYILKKEKIKPKFKYYKKWMSLGLVKRVLGQYFNNVKCYKYEELDDLKNKKRFITLIKTKNKFFHYVVIEKIDKDKIYYYDPLFYNLRRVKLEKFNRYWYNYCCFYQ